MKEIAIRVLRNCGQGPNSNFYLCQIPKSKCHSRDDSPRIQFLRFIFIKYLAEEREGKLFLHIFK